MNWHERRPPIRMSQVMMAGPNSDDREPSLLQCGDHLFARQCREFSSWRDRNLLDADKFERFSGLTLDFQVQSDRLPDSFGELVQ